MEEIHDPGGGMETLKSAANANDQSTMTPAMGGDRGDCLPRKMRTFAEILNEEQNYRNILEVKLIRLNVSYDCGELVKARGLTEDDISEFLFDVIGLKVEDCLGIALRTNRYDTKEIKLKKDVDPSPYVRSMPVTFKDHHITVCKQSNNLTRVTFRNVPFNIPDEEIIHLCKVYGEPLNNNVSYEKASTRTRGIPGATRYVLMKLSPGKQFEN